MLTNVSIARKLPIINGYVSIPDGQVLSPTSLTPDVVIAAIPGSQLMYLGTANSVPLALSSVGSGQMYRRLHGQMWIELPEFDVQDSGASVIYPSDWFQTIRDLT